MTRREMIARAAVEHARVELTDNEWRALAEDAEASPESLRDMGWPDERPRRPR